MLNSVFIVVPLMTTLITSIASATTACPADQHWVKEHFRRAYVRADGTHVSAANVIAHCHPNPKRYLNWVNRLKSGKPADWDPKTELAKVWTDEEKEKVLEAISDLPDGVFSNLNAEIYRLKASKLYSKNPASERSNSVVLYDTAFDRPQNLARIIAHELAHKMYRQLSITDLQSYLAATD